MTLDDQAHRPERTPADDVIGDRKRLLEIGMAAVFVACAAFGTLRFAIQIATGLATPWWANALGAAMITCLYLWFRVDPIPRSTVAVHVTALTATIALVVPAAYGLTSSKWWVSLVGFSVLLMGRRREWLVWVPITIVLVPLLALLEPSIRVPNAIGEPLVERVTAGLLYVALLLGVTWAFRQVANRRARELTETAASLTRANLVKNRFLAHMSHEVRTPLHGVIAMTDMALAEASAPAARGHVESAQQSARVLLALLNNVLDITRADADALELERRPFDLHAALTSVLRPLEAQARAKGVSLEGHADANVACMRLGDRVRVSQIVLNLVGNALKFTSTGGITVRLRKTNDAGRIALDVTDTGAGIAVDKLPFIFDPFVQADVADARVASGAGLGLAIVRELASLMGGRVGVSSEVGKGSTFSVELELPIDPDAIDQYGPEDLLAPLAHVSPRSSHAAVEERGLRVLACEDNVVNQKVLMLMLARLGHTADLAVDGEQAWTMLQSRAYDVLLTDVEMPGLDGVALTERIRDREKGTGEHLPILAATAHVGEAERHRLLEAGMDEHVPKPFTLADLDAALARTMRAR